MKMNLLPLLFALLVSANLQAQSTDNKASSPEVKAPLFGITFSGYVKTDILFDTRQTVGLREGQFLLYPDVEYKDAEGKDINAKSNFNMLSIQTRFAGTITLCSHPGFLRMLLLQKLMILLSAVSLFIIML